MARRAPALSPSRASDFRQCPLLFRLRTIDQVPEPPSAAATQGTLVHSVLEKLFDLPARVRTLEAAIGMLRPAWDELLTRNPGLGTLHETSEEVEDWLGEAAQKLETYFTLENPQRLEPDAREQFLEWQMPEGPLLRGIIDRVDVAPDGSIRIVDYKTGKAPAPQYGQQAKFQMRFYALLVSHLRGRLPSVLQLLYLKDGGTFALHPTDEDLDLVQHEILEVWAAIRDAATRSEWPPRRGQLCAWCNFHALCPEFGGTPPPLDPAAVEKALGTA
ncbi:MAG: PD-(D/E)XK nuclease family protein [Demequinaceae bacterium]|nr:PD-(D/E)XK nuclease family protein [Demequinaceae bacterium]